MAQLKCIVVTPERTVLDAQADFLALPLFDGELGVLPGRSPMIGRLGLGELRLIRDGQVTRFYVEEGFAEVLYDTVSVLTNRALRAEELDEAVAREELVTARLRVAHSPEQMELREQTISRARAKLRIIQRVP